MQKLAKDLSLILFAGLAFNVGYYWYFDFSLIKYLTYTDHILSVWSLAGMAFLAISLMTDLDEIENPKRSFRRVDTLFLIGFSVIVGVATIVFLPNFVFLTSFLVYYIGSDVARYGTFLSKSARLEILVASTLLAIAFFGYDSAIRVASREPVKVCGSECTYAVIIFVGERFSMFLHGDKIEVVPTSEIRIIEYESDIRHGRTSEGNVHQALKDEQK
ncbi:hypothetical protein [Frigidibacter sp.]|uniref:hypothetical protein n=1 Tax=Frigidibacter sp. TaxID=2586418 RepID=UPI002732B01D|nr:hypothetical protein [Frigidibacter sp.]MDP3339745.1 hypothetical protein [Frigidibacter sp.]